MTDGNDHLPTSAEALNDWRAAERDLAKATAGREAAEVAAEAAQLADRAAIHTAEAARAALEASTEAEQTARLTADASRTATLAARGELTRRQGLESEATTSEAQARDAYRAAEDRARAK